jgi:hypothetical protein
MNILERDLNMKAVHLTLIYTDSYSISDSSFLRFSNAASYAKYSYYAITRGNVIVRQNTNQKKKTLFRDGNTQIISIKTELHGYNKII